MNESKSFEQLSEIFLEIRSILSLNKKSEKVCYVMEFMQNHLDHIEQIETLCKRQKPQFIEGKLLSLFHS